MQGLFQNAPFFNGDVYKWDMSHVNVMESMFQGTGYFSRNLDNWDVSHVTDTARMFKDARAFNGLIGKWDVSRVTWMEAMFQGALSFNRDLSKWDVSRAKYMQSMFEGATRFSQKICGAAWTLSKARKDHMFDNSHGSICNSGMAPPTLTHRPPHPALRQPQTTITYDACITDQAISHHTTRHTNPPSYHT